MRGRVLGFLLVGLLGPMLLDGRAMGADDEESTQSVSPAICQYDGLGESADLGRSGYRIYNNSSTTRLRVICPLTNRGNGLDPAGGINEVIAFVRNTDYSKGFACSIYCRDADGSILESAGDVTTNGSGALDILDMKFSDRCPVIPWGLVTLECELPPRNPLSGHFSKLHAIHFFADGNGA